MYKGIIKTLYARTLKLSICEDTIDKTPKSTKVRNVFSRAILCSLRSTDNLKNT